MADQNGACALTLADTNNHPGRVSAPADRVIVCETAARTGASPICDIQPTVGRPGWSWNGQQLCFERQAAACSRQFDRYDDARHIGFRRAAFRDLAIRCTGFGATGTVEATSADATQTDVFFGADGFAFGLRRMMLSCSWRVADGAHGHGRHRLYALAPLEPFL